MVQPKHILLDQSYPMFLKVSDSVFNNNYVSKAIYAQLAHPSATI